MKNWIGATMMVGVFGLMIGCGSKEKASLRAENERLRAENAELMGKVGGGKSGKEHGFTTNRVSGESTKVPAVLEVTMLKVGPSPSGNWTAIAFEVWNRSDEFLDYWQVGADVFGMGGSFLGHGFKNGNNLQPGQKFTAELLIPNVNFNSIARWKPQIERLSATGPGQGGYTRDVTAKFKLQANP